MKSGGNLTAIIRNWKNIWTASPLPMTAWKFSFEADYQNHAKKMWFALSL